MDVDGVLIEKKGKGHDFRYFLGKKLQFRIKTVVTKNKALFFQRKDYFPTFFVLLGFLYLGFQC